MANDFPLLAEISNGCYVTKMGNGWMCGNF